MGQVIIVGDLNIAASQKDVHERWDYSKMYSPEEKALLHGLLGDYHDTWRELHPDVATTFTVWDEKTSARAFNEVPFHSPGLFLQGSLKCRVRSPAAALTMRLPLLAGLPHNTHCVV